MSRPSDPLLRLIRDLARKKAMNTAALATQPSNAEITSWMLMPMTIGMR